MTQTFLGFWLSQLCMFLQTANRLWRLGACREGQLHSDTWNMTVKERKKAKIEGVGERTVKMDKEQHNCRHDEETDE